MQPRPYPLVIAEPLRLVTFTPPTAGVQLNHLASKLTSTVEGAVALQRNVAKRASASVAAAYASCIKAGK